MTNKKTAVKAVDHSARGHSKVSPSKFKNFEKCGEYQQQQFGKPDHPVTIEGNTGHEALEEYWEGKKTWAKGLKRELMDLCQMCIDYVESSETCFGDNSALIVEPKLKVLKGIWGFVDLLVFSKDGKHVELCDWKFGYHGVEDAEDNLQGQGYTLGVFQTYPDVQSITVRFVQPRIDYITTHTYTRDDVPVLKGRLESIVGNVGHGRYNWNDKTCQYCTNCDCPILKNAAFSIIDKYTTEIAVPKHVHSSAITNPDHMAECLALVPFLQNFIDSVKHHAKEMVVKNAVEIPGYEVRYQKSPTTITDVQMAYDIANKKYGVTQDEFMSLIKKVSLGDLQNLAASHAKRGEKAKVKNALYAELKQNLAVKGGDGEVPVFTKSKQ